MALTYQPTTYGTAAGDQKAWLAQNGGYSGLTWDDFARQAARDSNFQSFATNPDAAAYESMGLDPNTANNPFSYLNPSSGGQNYYIGSDPENDKNHIIMFPGQDGKVQQLSVPKTDPHQMAAIMSALTVMTAGVGAGLSGYGGAAGLGAGEAASGAGGWISAEGGAGYLGGMAADAGALSGAAGAGAGGWTSGYDLAGGSSLPSGGGGFTTGSALADKAIEKVGTKAITSTLSGGGQTGGTGTGGMFGMADNSLINALLSGYVTNNNSNRITDTSNASADSIMAIANQLKDQGKFTPYNVTSGFGITGQDAQGNMLSTLTQDLVDSKGKAYGQMMNLLDPYTNQNVSGIANNAYGLSSEWLNKRANPLYAANEQKGLFGSGQMLDKAAGFDPEANARIEYDLMQQLYAPTRESDNLNMESRLLGQGRLGLSYGSGGAAPELMALKEAQRIQDLSATKDSRQLAFDRQNNLISQAGALGDIGAKSGAAGTAQQKAYYDMANGLFGMGMSGDKFINDMNASRIGQAGALQQQAYYGDEQLAAQRNQSIAGGSARSGAEQANARLFGNMAMDAEGVRSKGAMMDAAIKNQRDSAILQGVTGGGGAGGFLGGLANSAIGAGSDIIKQLISSGMPAQQAAQVAQQWIGSGDMDFSSIDPSTWSGAGDFDFDWLG